MAVSDPSNPSDLSPAVPASAADAALVDYLDGLLHDGEDFANASLDLFVGDDTPAISAKVTPLPARRQPRLVEALKALPETRPFAEPVTLPLRMPPLAAPPVEQPAPVIETRTDVAPVTVQIPVAREQIAAPEPAVALGQVEAVVETEAAVEAETIAEAETSASAAIPEWASNGRPQWAQNPFECLLFSAGGLTLAVPLVELGSIYPLERDDITTVFGQIDWFLGLIRTSYGNVRVVDSARVVMPERYRADMPEAYRFVITLHGSDWGLGVDALAGTTLLDPTAVRWRTERSKRPWLAGTVVDKMCALIDPAQLSHMFNQLDRKRRQ